MTDLIVHDWNYNNLYEFIQNSNLYQVSRTRSFHNILVFWNKPMPVKPQLRFAPHIAFFLPVHLLLTQSKMQWLLYTFPCASHTGSMFLGQGHVAHSSQPPLTNPSSAVDTTTKKKTTIVATDDAIAIIILDIIWLRIYVCFIPFHKCSALLVVASES